jgi:hypothetical protein
MSRVIDLTGKQFSNWKVLKREGSNKRGRAMWLCECQCENKTLRVVDGTNLRHNLSKSCGCQQKRIASEYNKISKRRFNTYDLSGEYGVGYTSKGEEFYFDLEDYDLIKDYCWCSNGDGYITSKSQKNTKECIILQRLIMDTPSEYVADHISHNLNDNRKLNLRNSAIQENAMNKCKASNNTSGVTGVSWHKKCNQWIARIGYKNENIYLGQFDDFDEAVKVRKEAEEKYHKEYSYNNSMKYAEEYIIK